MSQFSPQVWYVLAELSLISNYAEIAKVVFSVGTQYCFKIFTYFHYICEGILPSCISCLYTKSISGGSEARKEYWIPRKGIHRYM